MVIKGARYRFRGLEGGAKERLTFVNNKVVEIAFFSKTGKKLKVKKV